MTSEPNSLNSILRSLTGKCNSSADTDMFEFLSLRINCQTVLSQHHPDPITTHLPRGLGDAHFSTHDLQFSACELDHR